MTVNLQSTVYVEGYCLSCRKESFFYARLLELEMLRNINCPKCHTGEINVTKYETRR